MASATRDRRSSTAAGRRPYATRLRLARLAAADGTDLALQRAGTGGRPLVLANGLGGTMLAWRPLVERLAGRYRIVSWDYRGLYSSGPPAHRDAVRIEDHCADLEALVHRLGDERAVVMGWSMGVQVAVQFALARPERVAGLVLVCGAPGDPFAGVLHTATSRTWVPMACRLVEAAPRTFGSLVGALAGVPAAPRLLRRAGIVAPSCDLGVLQEMARQLSRIDWRTYARSMRAMGRHDAWPRLGELRTPTLVVGGTRDLFTPVETMARTAGAIPGAELLVLRGATHYAPLEFPAELAEAVDGFLDRRAGWGPASPRRGHAKKGGADVVEAL